MNNNWRLRRGRNASIFKKETAFVQAGTDWDDDTDTVGEGITFVTETGASKGIIEDTG